MGGSVKVVIITPENEVLSEVLYTGVENGFFYLTTVCQGNIKEGIKEILNIDVDKYAPDDIKKNHLAPYDYGLTIMDFPNNTIYSIQNYPVSYDKSLREYAENFKDGLDKYYPLFENEMKKKCILTVENLITVKKYHDNRCYTMKEIFPKLNLQEIAQYLKAMKDNDSNTIHKFISPLIPEDWIKGKIWDFYINPSYPKMKIHKYQENEVLLFLEDILNAGYQLNEIEKEKWNQYALKYNNDVFHFYDQFLLRKNLNTELKIHSNIKQPKL